MKKFITDSLLNKSEISFAMPGTKNKDVFEFKLSDDYTEFLNSDDLLNPSGVILKSQKKCAEIFNTYESIYTTSGSTQAILAAVSFIKSFGKKVLIDRASHRSIYSALIINNLKPDFLYPQIDEDSKILTGPDPKELDEMFKKNAYDFCIFTSPYYDGVYPNLGELIRIAKKNNAYVIVDEAHGAHLYFSRYIRESAIYKGADIVINSFHKSLPALTPASVIHLNNKKFKRDEFLRHLRLFHTSSPSYLILMSIERAIELSEKKRDKFELIESEINSLKKKFKLKLYEKNFYDPFKLLIPQLKLGSIVKKLYLEYNIRLEKEDKNFALAMFSIMNELSDIRKLDRALEGLDFKDKFFASQIIRPKRVLDSTLAFSSSKRVKLEDALGKISADMIYQYPPGVVSLCSGELIDEKVYKFLLSMPEENCPGISNGEISVYEPICDL